jgi:hypothetical protein
MATTDLRVTVVGDTRVTVVDDIVFATEIKNPG